MEPHLSDGSTANGSSVPTPLGHHPPGDNTANGSSSVPPISGPLASAHPGDGSTGGHQSGNGQDNGINTNNVFFTFPNVDSRNGDW